MKKLPVLVICLAMAGLVFAQGDEKKVEIRKQIEIRGDMQHGKMPGGMRRGDMMRKLNLTAEQKEKMGTLRTAHQKEMVATQAAIKVARIDMAAQIRSEKPDRALIETKIKEVSTLQLKAKLSFVDQMFKMKEILTPEQLKIWRDGAGDRMGMRGEFGKHRGMRGGMRGEAGEERED